MGGASSKLDENDWEKADGKLRSCDDTLDGAEPAEKYQVLYLTKKSVNRQREFDITDEEQNLVYTTRAVPGTIACFDVLGRGMDECLLRVTVDLARRYWIVYRFGVPSFPGQFADKVATNKLVAEYAAEGGRPTASGELSSSTATPLLFRKCCITVSWSRYMAVAALYGPPTQEMIREASIEKTTAEDLESSENSENDIFQQASLIANNMKERRSFDDEEGVDSEKVPKGDTNDTKSGTCEAAVADLNGDGDGAARDVDENDVRRRSDTDATDGIKTSETDANKLRQSASMPLLSQESDIPPDPWADPIQEETSSTHSRSSRKSRQQGSTSSSSLSSQRSSMRQSVRNWFKERSKSVIQSSEKYLSSTTSGPGPDPWEGILHFDRPLLLCQEIYNKIIGNHQTSIITKARALELLQQDMTQYLKEHLEGETSMVVNDADNPLMKTEEGRGVIESMQSSSSDNNDNNTGKNRGDRSGSKHGSPTYPSEPPREETKHVDENGTTKAEEGNHQVAEGEGGAVDAENKEQPLVAYWNWENTLRTHKMKMHVAKGGDRALHVVLAIIVNQVRYERNVIAMTI